VSQEENTANKGGLLVSGAALLCREGQNLMVYGICEYVDGQNQMELDDIRRHERSSLSKDSAATPVMSLRYGICVYRAML
jgi:hypothetical protein